jgi:hypothetical protein
MAATHEVRARYWRAIRRSGAYFAYVGAESKKSQVTHDKSARIEGWRDMEALKQGSDALFILLGGIMVLAMHAGFAFLELGTVRKKNQVNAPSSGRS